MPPAPPPPPQLTIVGHIVEYGTGRPVPGAVVTTELQVTPFTADANGEFRIGGFTIPVTFHATIEAQGYITRETFLRLRDGSRDVNVDLIPDRLPFSLTYYRDLARGVFHYGITYGLYRLPDSPKIYVRTVDQNGRPLEPEVLRLITTTLSKAVRDWSNGTLSVAALETGTETRPRETGWIIVNTMRDRDAGVCGRATLGELDGFIDLYEEICACGSIKIPASVVAHEVGHSLGFFHTNDRRDVMYPEDSGRCRSSDLSATERFHAGIVYHRTRDNLDQDIDPRTMTPLAHGSSIVVEN